MEQDCLPFRSTLVHPRFLWDSCYLIFSFICMLCRSLFVLLYFFFWPLCCLFFFDLRFWLLLWYLQTLPWNWYHQYAWVFNWQHAMFDGYDLTHSQHFDEYQLCFSSGWLVPLFVWGRLHTGVSYEKRKEVNPILLFHCLHYILCPLNK